MTTPRDKLIAQARDARRMAYAKYSNFAVGAALLAQDGNVFTGCNVENASYGMTICAERVAVFTAVSAGCRAFQAIALVTDGGHSPCGACRQVLAEFSPEMRVWVADVDLEKPIVEYQLEDLLPGRFEL